MGDETCPKCELIRPHGNAKAMSLTELADAPPGGFATTIDPALCCDETDGLPCQLRQSQSRIAELEALVREAVDNPWMPYTDRLRCRFCRRYDDCGHSEDCWVVRAEKALEIKGNG